MKLDTTLLLLAVLAVFVLLPLGPLASQERLSLDSAIGIWLFDEFEGDVAPDFSPNGNDGILINAPGRVDGMFGGALDFNGVDTCVTTGESLLNNLEELTIVAWVHPRELAANRIGLVGQDNAVEFGFINPETVQLFTGTAFQTDAPYPHPPGEWHHLAAVATQDKVQVYVDGEPTEREISVADHGLSFASMNIGGCGIFGGDTFFSGSLDEVAVFGSALTADEIGRIMNEGLEESLVVLPTVLVADSARDWSADGVQGANGWFNGYYNLTLDPDGTYQARDFAEFVNLFGPLGGPASPNGNHWTGEKWTFLHRVPGPWTELRREGTHPNGTNSEPGEEHWTIRRWVSDRTGGLLVTWHLRETNRGGSGVSGRLYHNDELVDAAAVSGGDAIGVTRSVRLAVEEGDTIDLAHLPVDPEGNRSDGADGSANRLTILEEAPPACDSIVECQELLMEAIPQSTPGFTKEELRANKKLKKLESFVLKKLAKKVAKAEAQIGAKQAKQFGKIVDKLLPKFLSKVERVRSQAILPLTTVSIREAVDAYSVHIDSLVEVTLDP